MIVVDWDETITKTDTIGILADTAYKCKREFEPKFDYFTNVYMEALKDYQSVNPESFQQEMQYQKGLKTVEMTSINALEKHRLFEGITKDDIRKQASKVQLRKSFVLFVNVCRRVRIPIKILSINWTSILIREVLAFHGVKDIDIYSNELEFRNEKCTGRFDPSISIRTGFDKYTKLQKLAILSPVTYIGDSRTDLLCLLGSQTGIVMNGGSLLRTLPWKIEVKPLNQFIANESSLYTGDWEEITKFIMREHNI